MAVGVPRGDLRRNPALHRGHLPCVRMDPGRNHERTRALRCQLAMRATEKGHLALPAPERVEENPQPLIQKTKSREYRMVASVLPGRDEGVDRWR